MAGFTIEPNLRPCYVKVYLHDEKRPWEIIGHDTQNALFHCWEQASEVVAPSMLNGGHPGGTVACMYGIVEFANGSISRARPEDIVFIDNKHEEYSFFVKKRGG